MDAKEHELPVQISDSYLKYPTENSKKRRSHAMFMCSCGNTFETLINRIKSGNTKSCGCLHKRVMRKMKTTHGLCSDRLYRIWFDMVRRTTDKSRGDYEEYGGRGISVCEEWLDVVKFVDDMDPSYKNGMSLDRINNDLGYSKENCRWATQNTQSQNTRRIRANNTSGFRGVSRKTNSNKWISQIMVDSKTVYLGIFSNKIDAAKAYDSYVIQNNLNHTTNGIL